ncbi:MAG TPA: cyclic nucleotide-binding domain-containing protein [Bdellovibrionota bacterium]|nr:cyclic nucleotide-binding domain-containing protein [Bdellovibrionota bacterium]
MVGIVKPAAAMLKEVRLLQSLTEAELTQLIQLGSAATYEEHANIVIEGELSWGLYFIVEGVVGIFKNNKLTGEPYDVGQLRHGNFFGEMSLVDDNPRSATVRALTNCQLFYISKDQFQGFLAASKDLKLRFYESCIHTIVTRLRELDDNYVISQYQLWKAAFKKEAA